jgi:organic radical activating enzyme
MAELETRSQFFCPAKWTELYLYLNHGTSNSCHHPIPHVIPKESLSNPAALHNTDHKLTQQKMMLAGQRPPECHMCWHIEDMNDTVVSDRIHKSQQWQDYISTLQIDANFVPPFIELVFDNYCNLACSYCDAGQSSTWAAKIHQRPLHLVTDHRQLYKKIHIAPGSTKSEYFDAWMVWWPQVKKQIKVIKISGGEPLISKNFWQFAKKFEPNDAYRVDINSNLSVDTALIDQFIDATSNLPAAGIGASIDAVGDLAQYVRQGLDYEQFLINVDRWCKSNHTQNKLWLQSTMNILSIWGLVDKLNLCLELRKKYPSKMGTLYTTIVRHPEFQSVLLLPLPIRQQLHNQLCDWLIANQQHLTTKERDMVARTSAYLISNPDHLRGFDIQQLTLDFKAFLQYYDQTAKQSYKQIYPHQFCEWVESI